MNICIYYSLFNFRASDPGGLANPGFTEEPPPDYSSAVASTQV